MRRGAEISALCLSRKVTDRSETAVAGGGNSDIWMGMMGNQKVAIKIQRRFRRDGPVTRGKLRQVGNFQHLHAVPI